MNERILALAKECGLCDEDGDFFGAKNSAHEKFAELIVRERAEGKGEEALQALSDRLAQPEQEPVAWNGECVLGHCGSPSGCDDSGCCRAAPPSIEAAVLAEREACAEICETIYQNDDITQDWLEDAAKAIRARGGK